MADKTCYNCRNSIQHNEKQINNGKVPGDSFCLCEKDLIDIGENDRWNRKKMPNICEKYEPQIIDTCAYCQREINMEEFKWEIWAGMASRPVCSWDCGAKLYAAEIAYYFSD